MDEQAFGREYVNGGETEAEFDTFYAEGAGLSWRKDNKEDRTHLDDEILEVHPHKQVGTEEEPAVHNRQSREQLNTGNGIIFGDERADLRKPKIKIGDEVKASLRVKGNNVKEINGIVSEISKNGYVRLSTCKRWLTFIRNSRSAEKTEGCKAKIPKNKKINGISVEISDTGTIRFGRSKQRTGIVSAVSHSETMPIWKMVKTCRDNQR